MVLSRGNCAVKHKCCTALIVGCRETLLSAHVEAMIEFAFQERLSMVMDESTMHVGDVGVKASLAPSINNKHTAARYDQYKRHKSQDEDRLYKIEPSTTHTHLLRFENQLSWMGGVHIGQINTCFAWW